VPNACRLDEMVPVRPGGSRSSPGTALALPGGTVRLNRADSRRPQPGTAGSRRQAEGVSVGSAALWARVCHVSSIHSILGGSRKPSLAASETGVAR
jgi:hypothetical protein